MEDISRRLLAQLQLSEEATATALDLTGLRPTSTQRREFAARAMRFAGVLSLAAGIIFFVAFDWQDLGLYARFALVEFSLFIALAVAWIKGTDRLPGKLALTLAVLLTGALLALFGQTYQSGANLYELFLAWALLALPWVIACRYAPCWAIWLLIVNAAFALYSATDSRWSLPFLVDVLLYVALVILPAETWLRRGIMALAMAFGTFLMVFRIFDQDRSVHVALEVLLFVGASIAFAAFAYAKKQDLFNFAVLALSWIVVSTALIGRTMSESHAGAASFFVIAIYVIGASTGAVKGISYVGQQWRTPEIAK